MPPPNDPPDDDLKRAIDRLAATRAARRAREAAISRELPAYGDYCEDCQSTPCRCEPTHPQIIIERGANARITLVTETGKHRAQMADTSDPESKPDGKIEAGLEAAEGLVTVAGKSWRHVASFAVLVLGAVAAFVAWLILK
jgi:hypothetical protein